MEAGSSGSRTKEVAQMKEIRKRPGPADQGHCGADGQAGRQGFRRSGRGRGLPRVRLHPWPGPRLRRQVAPAGAGARRGVGALRQVEQQR